MNIIGRTAELDQIQQCLHSGRPEFLVLYGRRRVGKTYLIRNHFRDRFAFYATGIANEKNAKQLQAFHDSLKRYGHPEKKAPSDWIEAFSRVRDILEEEDVIRDTESGRRVVFLDELPWMDAARSDFKAALDYFWNSFASAKPDILLIVCGSAASWIINNILTNTGGLYNRVTRRIHLKPFSLHECEAFFQAMNLPVSGQTVLESYMVFGGIPHYLNLLDRRLSLSQNIEQLCFSPTGELRDEFDLLFRSLFRHAEKHVAIIEKLAEKRSGFLRTEIAKVPAIGDGEPLTKALKELEQCGFIRKYRNFTKQKNGCFFQLIDPFTLFWLKFRRNGMKTAWMDYIGTPGYHAWCGNAFELVCLLHIDQIKQALGIAGIGCDVFAWRSSGTMPGAQIDLLIDRRDNVINLCEMKYTEHVFSIDASYEKELRNKRAVFTEETKTKKATVLTLITMNGLKNNMYAGIVDRELTADDLFLK